MSWESYHTWCNENRLPVLVRPAGLRQAGNHVYNENDGLLYVGREPVGKFLTVCRYAGIDLILKAENVDNANRFEALRWKVLVYLKGLYERRNVLVDRLFEVMGRERSVQTMHNEKLYELALLEDRTYGRRADGGPIAQFHKLGPLEKLSKIPKDSPARRLASQWFELRDRIYRYIAIASNLGDCLHTLLARSHPDDINSGRLAYFQINDRLYPVARNYVQNRDKDYWPSPLNTLIVQVS